MDGVDLEAVVQPPFRGRLGEGRDQADGGGEEHAVAGLDGLEAEAHGQVRLADARGAEQDDVFAMLDEVTALSVWICF